MANQQPFPERERFFYEDPVAATRKALLYVGNVDEQVDANILAGAFNPFGEILHLTIPRDTNAPRHRGFAYIEFEDPEDAQHAIDNMNDSELYGRVLRVNLAKPSSVKGTAVWHHSSDEFYKQLASEGAPSSTSSTAASASPSSSSSSSSSSSEVRILK